MKQWFPLQWKQNIDLSLSPKALLSPKPLVSIVIPVFNGSNYLRESIRSALNQTYSNIEIIVVNDGSNDSGATQSVAKEFGEAIIYLEKNNGGVGSALNFGIKMMSGKYFSWLSHDDIYYPHKIETQVGILESINHTCVLYANWDTIDINKKLLWSSRIIPIEPSLLIADMIIRHPLNGCTMLIPKECFDDTGLFDEAQRTTQDYDLFFRMARCFRFYHLDTPCVQQRLHPQQDTLNLSDVHLAECERLYAGFIDMLPEALSESKQSEKLQYILFWAYIGLNRKGHRLAAKKAMDAYMKLSRGTLFDLMRLKFTSYFTPLFF